MVGVSGGFDVSTRLFFFTSLIESAYFFFGELRAVDPWYRHGVVRKLVKRHGVFLFN